MIDYLIKTALFVSLISSALQAQVFQEYWGADNPLNRIDYAPEQLRIIDLDNDGDNDVWMLEKRTVGGQTTYHSNYYENVGSSTTPLFRLLPNDTLLPLGLLSNQPTFVDIDLDGDWDLFSSNRDSSKGLNHYKNIGTTSNPVFIQLISVNNPMNAVGNDMRGLGLDSLEVVPTFTDTDGDGDQDCFLFFSGAPLSWDSTNFQNKILYYENVGTVRRPFFSPDTPHLLTPLINGLRLDEEITHAFFEDLNRDGYADLAYQTNDQLLYSSLRKSPLIGDEFDFSNNIFSNLNTNYPTVSMIGIGYLDNSFLLQVFGTSAPNGIRFFVEKPSAVSTLSLPPLLCFPNPAQNHLTVQYAPFQTIQPKTIRWRILNATGQIVLDAAEVHTSAEMYTVDVRPLPPGWYVLEMIVAGQPFAQQLFIKT